MPCKNAIDSNQTFSLCVLNLYGGKPSHGTCVNCDKCTDVEWHRKKVAEMLARPPVTPVSRIVVTRPVLPVPRSEWPMWASSLEKYATTEDAGIGDVIHRLAGRPGVWFEWTTAALGIPCNCPDRRARFNKQFPLK